MTTDRIETEYGGYAVAFFSDERGIAVEKDQATRVVVTEYDQDGHRLAETFADLGAGYSAEEQAENPLDATTNG